MPVNNFHLQKASLKAKKINNKTTTQASRQPYKRQVDLFPMHMHKSRQPLVVPKVTEPAEASSPVKGILSSSWLLKCQIGMRLQ